MRKKRIGNLGLAFAALLLLMALTASAASAELKSTALLVGGTNLKVGTPETSTGAQESTAVFSIPAKDAEIRCEKTEISEGKAENETVKEVAVGKTTGKATL